MKIRMLAGLLAVAVLAETGFGQSGITREQIQGWTNIFSRTRTTSATRVPGAAGAMAPAPIFIGVIKQDGGYVGVLQTSNGRGGIVVVSVRKGDTIAWDKSRVSEVTWESLYLQGGSRAKGVVELGHDLLNDSKIPAPGPVYKSLDDPTSGIMPGAGPRLAPTGRGPVRTNRNPLPRNGATPGGLFPGGNRSGIRGRAGGAGDLGPGATSGLGS